MWVTWPYGEPVAHQAPQFMGILQARILEWVAMLSSRGSSQPTDQTQVSHIAVAFTLWATREALSLTGIYLNTFLTYSVVSECQFFGGPGLNTCSKLSAVSDNFLFWTFMALARTTQLIFPKCYLRKQKLSFFKHLHLPNSFQWSCMDVRVGLWRKLSAEELTLLNCSVGEDSWESLGLQGDPTSPF